DAADRAPVATEHADALARAAVAGVAFDRDELAVLHPLDQSGVAFAAARADDEDAAGPDQGRFGRGFSCGDAPGASLPGQTPMIHDAGGAHHRVRVPGARGGL